MQKRTRSLLLAWKITVPQLRLSQPHPLVNPQEPGRTLIRAGLVLHVLPHDAVPWIGNVERGARGIEGVAHTPDREVLPAIVDGQGYLIAARDPSGWKVVDVYGIQGVILVFETQSFVFVDGTGLACYACDGGYRWGGRIAIDDLQVTDVTGTTIRGTAWDTVGTFEFAVDAQTGECAYVTPMHIDPWWQHSPGLRHSSG